MIRLRVSTFVFLAASLILSTLPARAQDKPTSEVIITIDPEKPAAPLSAEYTGLSFGLQNIEPLPSDNTYLFRPDNKPLVTLFKTLGIHVIRIADNYKLTPPTTADLDSLFTFAQAANCKVELELCATDNPADLTPIVKHINDHYKNDLLDYEMHPYARANNFKEAFNALIAALKAPDVSPDLPLTSPDLNLPLNLPDIPVLLNEYPDKSLLSSISLSGYPGGQGGTVPDPAASRASLLSSSLNDQYQKWYDTVSPSLAAAKLPFRFVETNSFYSSGAKDVSNTHAAALWTLDYLHWWAAHGCAGLCLHVGGRMADPASVQTAYAPFWTASTGYHPNSPAYGIKAFDLSSHGTVLPVTVITLDNLNLTAYAVMDPDKSIYLTLINKELGDNAKNAKLKLALPNYHIEQLLTLTADNNDPASPDTEKLGDTRINDDGTFTPTWTTTTEESPTVSATTATILHIKHD